MGLSTRPPVRRPHRRRLRREDWLGHALETLKHQGLGAIGIRRLAGTLGVTIGSFYWHFENEETFHQQLLDYWRDVMTTNFIEDVETATDEPSERLLRLMEVLDDSQVAAYDVPVRAWAQHDARAAAAVKAVDEDRLAFLREEFGALGFRGDELMLRTRLFLHYQLAEPNILIRSSRRERGRLRRLRHVLLTKRGE